MNTDQYRGKRLFLNGKPILADELFRQKVVFLNELFREPKEIKLRWWSKVHPLRLLQIPVGIAIAIFAVYGLVLSAKEVGHSSGTIWAIAFWLMFFFWVIEYSTNKHFDLYKTED